MADIKFEIINQIGVVERNGKGWQLEVNRVSWNGAEPKYDIRTWSADHEKMGKGITLNSRPFSITTCHRMHLRWYSGE